MKPKNPPLKAKQPHSAEYLGEHRDFWWNRDFLDLMAKRWNLAKCHSVLDVGCGTGHWGRALFPYLPPQAKLIGVDKESEWVRLAQEHTKDDPEHFEYKVSSAEKIPFADGTFDMVTCQTLLIHVKDAQAVLKEMYRVLRPGGLLMVAEPNNTISELLYDTVSLTEDVQDIVKTVEFHLICEKGQRTLGKGFGSLGDLVPNYFQELGLTDIHVYASDKTEPLIPPYASEEQQVFIKQIKEWCEAELLIWPKDETKKYFLAGGGDPKAFEATWNLLKRRFQSRVEAIDKKTYSTTGGCLLYLISGIK